MRFFKVRNWDKLQHYKDRSPPWIKLYNDLLENYEFSMLEDNEKFHLLGIYLLASRASNKLPFDSKGIKRKMDANSEVDLDRLLELEFVELWPDSDTQALRLQDDSQPLADCSSDCIESREEQREEKEQKAGNVSRFDQMLKVSGGDK